MIRGSLFAPAMLSAAVLFAFAFVTNAQAQIRADSRVTGVVTYQGKPVADAEVRVVSESMRKEEDNEYFDFHSGGFPPLFQILGSTRTDAAGRYEIEIDPESETTPEKVQARKGGLGDFRAKITNDGAPVNVELHEIATVRGRVKGPKGIDLSETTITVRGDHPDCVVWENMPSPVSKDGEFAIDLDSGLNSKTRDSPRIMAEGPFGYAGLGPFFREFYAQNDKPEVQRAHILEAKTQDVVIELKPLRSGSILFVDQFGKPLVDQPVHMMPSMGMGGPGRNWAPYGIHGLTDDKGIVHYSDAWPEKMTGKISGDKALATIAFTPSQAQDKAPATIKVKTVLAERFFGKVTNKEGKPVENAALILYMQDPGADDELYPSARGGLTDAEGNFAITDLPKLPSRIVFFHPDWGAYAIGDSSRENARELSSGERKIELPGKGKITEFRSATRSNTSEMDNATRQSVEGIYEVALVRSRK